jgi:imidazolonepropionase-like amidohydrolase
MIKKGYQADLVLLDSNPLEDISAVRQQSGVMIGGDWLDRETIDQRLQTLAAKYQSE